MEEGDTLIIEKETFCVYRCTIDTPLRVLEGVNPCPSCKGRGFIRKMSGKAPCFNCDSTGDANHPPYDDSEDEEEFKRFIDRLTKRTKNESSK